MRKLVSIRTVNNISHIENADAIERLSIDGWNIVSNKGVHSVGDKVVYFEIDSFLPKDDIRFEQFMKFGTNIFEGREGHRVKTKRLRGVYSQGVVIPLSEFPELLAPVNEGKDFAEILKVVKYEKQEVTGYKGDVQGTFPWFLRKSDQERIQNVYHSLRQDFIDEDFVGTLKMDGSSITVFSVNKEKYFPDSSSYTIDNWAVGYCSRNQLLKFPEMDLDILSTGKFFQGASNSELFEKCVELSRITGKSLAIQGELVGAGIQGGFEKFETYRVFSYNIYDVELGKFVPYNVFKEYTKLVNLSIVPEMYSVRKILSNTLEEIVSMADGVGLLAKYREGIVWKQLNGDCQFKAISNKYLAKES